MLLTFFKQKKSNKMKNIKLTNEFKTEITRLIKRNMLNSLKKNKLNNVCYLTENNILKEQITELICYLQTEFLTEISNNIKRIESENNVKSVEKKVINYKQQIIYSEFIKKLELFYNITDLNTVSELYNLHVNSLRHKQYKRKN